MLDILQDIPYPQASDQQNLHINETTYTHINRICLISSVQLVDRLHTCRQWWLKVLGTSLPFEKEKNVGYVGNLFF